MLEPVKHILSTKRIILASGSPRRAELLHNLGLKCEVIPSTYEENLDPKDFPSPAEYVTETAKNKVLEVANRLSSDATKPDLIIGCDTTVAIDGNILGKPKDRTDAFNMLTRLSGKPHKVFTAVILKTHFSMESFCCDTKVYFGSLTPEVIEGYIETGEPLDKAGAYGIQGIGGSIVEKIEGDYFTVVGLPLYETAKHVGSICTQYWTK